MDVDWSRSGARKACGLGSGMTLDVSAYMHRHSGCGGADAVKCSVAMRRVLHLKMVTQCAMLEDFGIFLVLADKVSIIHLSYFSQTNVASTVAVCLPHRGVGSVVASKSSHISDAAKAQW